MLMATNDAARDRCPHEQGGIPMRCLQVSILAAALGVAIVTFAPPAAATDKTEASKLCKNRGNECFEVDIGGGKTNFCVDNSSTGHGLQCVECEGSNPCVVMRRTTSGTPAEGVLTNSIEVPDVSGLDQRVRILEERVKALEKRK
jgi:hypothetical protein